MDSTILDLAKSRFSRPTGPRQFRSPIHALRQAASSLCSEDGLAFGCHMMLSIDSLICFTPEVSRTRLNT